MRRGFKLSHTARVALIESWPLSAMWLLAMLMALQPAPLAISAETFTRVSVGVGVGVADGVVEITGVPDAELPEPDPCEFAPATAMERMPQPPNASTHTAAIAITMRRLRATEKLRHPPVAMRQC